MNSIAISARTLGVNFNDVGEAQVVVWAPEAETLEVVLGDSRLAMTKKELGYWELTTRSINPGDLYQLLLNGTDTYPDPASVGQPQGVHGPSQAVNLRAFAWNDTGWSLPLDRYVIYEIHTGTFTKEGTFAALEQKLDYLVELGITAVELMPVAQFPGARNWGYDGVFPYAVQDSYGGAHALQHLVDCCHQKGLAVILDVVYNHLGPEGNYLGAFGKYVTDKYHTPWGGAINFDDAWCDGVRRFVVENVLMWFRDFHIDALRMDAVHAFKDFSPIHIVEEIRAAVDTLMQQTGRTHYLIAELDLNDNRFIAPAEEGGYGMDAQWIDEFHHALRVTSGEARDGYYSDFQGIRDLAKSYTDAYVYDGQFSEHRKKFFGTKANTDRGEQFVVFSQNHDHIGNRMLGERTSQLVSFEMQKLLAGAVLMSPYLPMLFMGEEWGETNPFLYFVSHTDPELAEAVRQGRKREFAAFHAKGEAPDPMAPATFEESKIQWQLLKKEPHQALFRYYQTLISLRKELPALRHLSRKNCTVDVNEAKQTLLLQRWHQNQPVLCLMNFSEQPQVVSVPESPMPWQKLLYSAETNWGGPASDSPLLSSTKTVNLHPHSLLICAHSHV